MLCYNITIKKPKNAVKPVAEYGLMAVMNAYKLYDFRMRTRDAQQERLCYNKPSLFLRNMIYFAT
ncbi:hypothetical protein BJJ98_09350 [Dickeya solani]|nr:hypothetical protein A4U42_11650 [Dickeya solani IPO 2222]AUH08660.1 hypothetical protein BJD21_09385 [Dickeya solani D s0432-1]AUH12651.1 hypothetical protein BJJ98_09350 [Dickeya solani]